MHTVEERYIQFFCMDFKHYIAKMYLKHDTNMSALCWESIGGRIKKEKKKWFMPRIRLKTYSFLYRTRCEKADFGVSKLVIVTKLDSQRKQKH